METPAQRCARITTALEDLVAQEAAAVRDQDFAAVEALQERTAPLVEFLVSNASAARLDETLGTRIAALQSRRQETADVLEREITRTRAELSQTSVAQRRVAQVAPVYGRAETAKRSRLSGVG